MNYELTVPLLNVPHNSLLSERGTSLADIVVTADFFFVYR